MVSKLFWSEYHKRLGEIAIGIEGADGPAPSTPGTSEMTCTWLTSGQGWRLSPSWVLDTPGSTLENRF
jgi:hypothetical protein